jgi:hypothetical protein
MSGVIIGVSGKAGSGKDTIAKYLHDEYGFATLAFADPMKAFCAELFDWSYDQLWGPSELREQVDQKWGFSPRKALQLLGTEWGRALDENMWVKIGLEKAKQKIKDGYPGVVITDCRFKNEIGQVKAAGGSLLRVVRSSNTGGSSGVAGHASEREQDSIQESEFSAVIRNEGTIEDLHRRIEDFLDAIGAPTNNHMAKVSL